MHNLLDLINIVLIILCLCLFGLIIIVACVNFIIPSFNVINCTYDTAVCSPKSNIEKTFYTFNEYSTYFNWILKNSSKKLLSVFKKSYVDDVQKYIANVEALRREFSRNGYVVYPEFRCQREQ